MRFLPDRTALLAVVQCLLLLDTSVRRVGAQQQPVPPFFTACTFPSPLGDPGQFSSACAGEPAERALLCDVHGQLGSAGQAAVARMAEKVGLIGGSGGGAFGATSTWNRSALAILLVRQLSSPQDAADVYDDERWRCLLDTAAPESVNNCAGAAPIPVDAHTVQAMLHDTKVFLRVLGWRVHERWFGPAACSLPHPQNHHHHHHNHHQRSTVIPSVLAIISTDGLLHDARRISYVHLHTSEPRLRHKLAMLEAETTSAIARGLPLTQVLEDLVDDVTYALHEHHELGGKPREHTVPMWAKQVGALCVALIVAALVIEWYIVRRKLAVKTSVAAHIKLRAGKSKTHLMF